jgi:hypothetical protein
MNIETLLSERESFLFAKESKYTAKIIMILETCCAPSRRWIRGVGAAKYIISDDKFRPSIPLVYLDRVRVTLH